MKRRILFILVLVAAVGAAVYYFYFRPVMAADGLGPECAQAVRQH